MRKKIFVPLLPDAVAMGHIGYGAFGVTGCKRYHYCLENVEVLTRTGETQEILRLCF